MAYLKSPIWNYFRVREKDMWIMFTINSTKIYYVWETFEISFYHTIMESQRIYPDIYGKLKNVGHSSKAAIDDLSIVFQKIQWIDSTYSMQ